MKWWNRIWTQVPDSSIPALNHSHPTSQCSVGDLLPMPCHSLGPPFPGTVSHVCWPVHTHIHSIHHTGTAFALPGIATRLYSIPACVQISAFIPWTGMFIWMGTLNTKRCGAKIQEALFLAQGWTEWLHGAFHLWEAQFLHLLNNTYPYISVKMIKGHVCGSIL